MAGSKKAIEAHLSAKGPIVTPPTACNIDGDLGRHGLLASHDDELFSLLGEFGSPTESVGDLTA